MKKYREEEERHSLSAGLSILDSYAHQLDLSDILREKIILSAIQELHLLPGSRGLDAGCGTGSNAQLLAAAVAPDGHVIGMDILSDLLDHARKLSDEAGLSLRLSFQQGDVRNIPFDDNSFDWAWSADCVGIISVSPVLLLAEIARVVKPHGIIAILAWSSQQLLPGYPVLEARLNGTSMGIAPFTRNMRPQQHFLRALGWFREAGLQNPRAQTFVGSVHAPLSEEVRLALTSLFGMRWGEAQLEMSAEDGALYQRLTLPESPDFILDSPDYCAFFTYSMFWGEVK
jgi:ubiquinone/menaquinone biosynthesis C-methylase UbiE